MSTPPAIEVEHLDVSFGNVRAVQGLSFSVGSGDSYGIVGESGSGKSTVLRALVGLYQGWKGSMTILGEPQRKVRTKMFYRAVQMVFQDPYASLHPKFTVEDTLAEPLVLSGIRDRGGRVAKAMSDVGLPSSFRFRYPHQLSGGQRQRVAIARALMLEPRVLLLDEPTSALDKSIQATILNLLCDLRSERRLTYVFVSHDLAVVGHMCDRVLVMRDGMGLEEIEAGNLAAGPYQTEYARELIRCSAGFRRTFDGCLPERALTGQG